MPAYPWWLGRGQEESMELAKAEESLNAAELCYAQGFYNSAANRAYYAMFVRRESAV